MTADEEILQLRELQTELTGGSFPDGMITFSQLAVQMLKMDQGA